MDKKIQKKLDIFFFKYPQIHFKKDEIIIGASDLVTHVYYLKAGYVKQRYITQEGEELIIHIFKPISFFPMMTAISEQENEFDFIAMESMVMYRAPVEDVINFMKKNPDVLFNLATRFAQGINGLIKRILSLTFVDSYAKLSSILYYLAEDIGISRNDEVVIPIHLTHTDLSSWLGISRETVSRHFEILEKQGLVFYDDYRIVITNLNALKTTISKEHRFQKEN